jgi:hypothetical protein
MKLALEALRRPIKPPLGPPYARVFGALLAATVLITTLGACGSSSSSTSASATTSGVAATSSGAATSSSAAVAPATVTGKYVTTITKPAMVKATWTLDFNANGSVTVMRNGQLTANHASLKGSIFTAPGGNGKGCPGVGTYMVKLTGKKLTFTVIKDACTVGRKLILPGHTFIKVG